MGRHKQEVLSEKQIQCIDMLVFSDKTRLEIAAELGIARSTLYKWLSDEKFKEELKAASERLIASVQGESLRRIKALMRQDDDKRTALASAKLLTELSGLSTTSKVELKTTDIRVTLSED